MTRRAELERFVRGIPKVDLHLHLVGSAPSSFAANLVLERSQPTREPSKFASLTEFLDAYTSVTKLITRGEHLVTLADFLSASLARDNVIYSEVTVTPSGHPSICAQELAEALDEGARRAKERGICLAWVLDADSSLGPELAVSMVEEALRFPPQGLVAIGLGGPEIGYPRRRYRDAFELARANGLPAVPHAGETGDPQEVWDAVDVLCASRIGHGLGAAKDSELLDYLRRHRIAVEVCPTSNVRTGAVGQLAEHPARLLHDCGVRISVGTDDPGLFDTDLVAEYMALHDHLGFDEGQLVTIARNGVRAALCDDSQREQMSSALDAADRMICIDQGALEDANGQV